MKNKWENRGDIDPDYDPKEIVDDIYKKFTYQELFDLSIPLNDEEFSKYKKWNQISVSSFDSFEQIFYDIAHSKNIKKIYLKTTFIAIIFCFVKLLPLLYLIFTAYGLIVSKFTFFIMEMNYWKILLAFAAFSFIIDQVIEDCFINYLPTDQTGKIDMSYRGNKTLHFKFESSTPIVKFTPYSHIMMIRPSFFIRHKRPKFAYRYCKYIANNGKEYLIDTQAEGRYYSIRNWYLISKYITLGKMKISELGEHFENELFVYLNNNDFKKDKLKLRSFFGKRFSLYFMASYSDWLSIIYFFIVPILSGILCLSIW